MTDHLAEGTAARGAGRSGYRGYIFTREINGSIIPQRVQNLVIRRYAESRGMTFHLSATEYYMDRCHMMLSGILEDLSRIEGIIFYSTHLLPEDPDRRRKLYERVLASSVSLHFALEELSIGSAGDVAMVEDLAMVREISAGWRPPFERNHL